MRRSMLPSQSRIRALLVALVGCWALLSTPGFAAVAPSYANFKPQESAGGTLETGVDRGDAFVAQVSGRLDAIELFLYGIDVHEQVEVELWSARIETIGSRTVPFMFERLESIPLPYVPGAKSNISRAVSRLRPEIKAGRYYFVAVTGRSTKLGKSYSIYREFNSRNISGFDSIPKGNGPGWSTFFDQGLQPAFQIKVEAGPQPEFLSPAPDENLGGPSVAVRWTNNGVAATNWWLYVGTALGKSDVYDSGSLGSATTATVTSLPTAGQSLYLRLWYKQKRGAGVLWIEKRQQQPSAPRRSLLHRPRTALSIKSPRSVGQQMGCR